MEDVSTTLFTFARCYLINSKAFVQHFEYNKPIYEKAFARRLEQACRQRTVGGRSKTQQVSTAAQKGEQ